MRADEVRGCLARSIRKAGDYCGNKTIPGGEYCRRHTCIVRGCKEPSAVYFPLIKGEPRFCDEHFDNPPKKWKELIKASREPPDDFDVPWW